MWVERCRRDRPGAKNLQPAALAMQRGTTRRLRKRSRRFARMRGRIPADRRRNPVRPGALPRHFPAFPDLTELPGVNILHPGFRWVHSLRLKIVCRSRRPERARRRPAPERRKTLPKPAENRVSFPAAETVSQLPIPPPSPPTARTRPQAPSQGRAALTTRPSISPRRSRN